jgi:hypothetical protein
MTARRDPDHLIRTYLDDGPTELPDYSYDAVRAQIDHTRQRVVFGPWREPNMSKFVAFATAAAAVLVVAALVGLSLMPRQGLVGGPGPTVAPTAAPAPTASPAPIVSPAPTAAPAPAAAPSPPPSPSADGKLLPRGDVDLAAGTYYIADWSITGGPRLTFTLPAGWTTEEYAFLYKQSGEPGEVMFTPWFLSHIYSDACLWDDDQGLVDVGTTVDELVSALADQAGREVSAGPRDVTLGGYPGVVIELTVPADLDVSTCTSGSLRYWPGWGPDFDSGLCCNPAGNTDAVHVVDVDGKRLVVVARHYPDSSAENRAELQAILDSIQIDP